MSDYGADADPMLNKIATVAFQYRFANLLNLKVDQFSTATDRKVFHLVRKIGSTNLSILVDPNEIPG